MVYCGLNNNTFKLLLNDHMLFDIFMMMTLSFVSQWWISLQWVVFYLEFIKTAALEQGCHANLFLEYLGRKYEDDYFLW